MSEPKLSPTFLKVLIGLFYWSILAPILSIGISLWLVINGDIELVNPEIGDSFETAQFANRIMAPFFIPVLFFWGYCLYFYYKYDRYSSGLLSLFLFGWVYPSIYFYRVIWKRKRPLNGKIEKENPEPILGNTIHIESEDDEPEQSR